MPAATPYLSCDQVAAAYTKWHVPHAFNARWRVLCRCHSASHDKGSLSNEVRDWLRPAGFLLHITAGALGKRTPEIYNEDIILGDPNVPLKAQFLTAPGRTITGKPAYVIINSCGRANHVMAMSRAAYDLFRNASWPLTGTVDRRGSDVDAKAYLYGWEMIAAKKADPEQLEVTLRAIAALADAYGWTGQETAGHGEVDSTRTPADPNENMGKIRQRVMALVKAGPNADPIYEEDDMPITSDDVRKIWTTDNILPNPVIGQGVDAKNSHWTANSIIGYAARHSLLAERGTASNTKQIAELSGQLAGLKEAVGKIIAGQPINLDDVDAAARKAAGEVVTAAFEAAAEAAKGEVQ